MAVMGVPDRKRQQDTLRSSPRFGWRMYPPHVVAAIVAELGKQGIDASAALENTDLIPSQLDAHTTRVSYRQLEILVRNALRLSNDSAMALRAGLRMHVTAYGMYGYALLSSATSAQATDFAGLFGRVHGPFCNTAYASDGAATACVLVPVYGPNPAEDLHRFSVEFALSVHLTMSRDLFGQAFRFSRVVLDYPPPPHAEVYESLLECPILFEQSSCRYECPSHLGTLTLADARTHAMAREACEQILDEVNRGSGVVADIWRLLIEQPGQYPNFEKVAEKLGILPRVLMRKLKAEGTTYRDVLARVRMRLAVEYLRTTDLTLEQIGSQLGYSDASNFRHAFIRWTGKNPSDFRSDGRD